MCGMDTRAAAIAAALMMDRIKDGGWCKKTDESEDGDTYADPVPVKLRRVSPSFRLMQANQALFAQGACVWQVIDVGGTLMDQGFDVPSGYLLVDGDKWFVRDVMPTAAEALLLCTCTREPR